MNTHADYLETIRDELHRRRGEWNSISETSGVPYFTIAKISQGVTKNPRWMTIVALSGVLFGEGKAA